MAEIDARTADQDGAPRRGQAQLQRQRAVILILQQRPGIAAVGQWRQQCAHTGTHQFRLHGLRCAQIAEAGYGIHAGAHTGQPGGQRAGGDGFQRHMMHDVGPFPPVQPCQYPDRRQLVGNPALAAPGQRDQAEALLLDALAMRVHAGRHQHLEAGIARGARLRQAVRPEIPVLGNQKQKPAGQGNRPSISIAVLTRCAVPL